MLMKMVLTMLILPSFLSFLPTPHTFVSPSRAASTMTLSAEGGGGWFGRRRKKDDDKDDESDVDDELLPERLPISFRTDNGTRDAEFDLSPLPSSPASSSTPGGALSSRSSASLSTNLNKNEYSKMVSSLTPSDLIGRFMSTAPHSVQTAVKTTILGLVGTLPKMAFDTSVTASTQRLASLCFQLQMTGYMFKNAEYRLSLNQSLNTRSLPGTVTSPTDDASDPVVRGKVKVSVAPGQTVEVDADAYMGELRSEVTRLRAELARTREKKEAKERGDLLGYIRGLPEQQMMGLTNTITPDVLEAMRNLVDNVLAGIDSDDDDASVTSTDGKGDPDTVVTVESGNAIAELCMWQLVTGYNLRELEVREEFESQFKPEDN